MFKQGFYYKVLTTTHKKAKKKVHAGNLTQLQKTIVNFKI